MMQSLTYSLLVAFPEQYRFSLHLRDLGAIFALEPDMAEAMPIHAVPARGALVKACAEFAVLATRSVPTVALGVLVNAVFPAWVILCFW